MHGLTSALGTQLNGCFGTIIKYDSQKQRLGVDVDGVGSKAIRAENLTRLAPATHANASAQGSSANPASPMMAAAALDGEELMAQGAIEASLLDTSSTGMQGERDINAQVSDAVLRSRAPDRFVLLTTFTRDPRALDDAIVRSPEIAEWRQALQAHGYNWKLPCGTKVLVWPQDFEPVLWTIRESGHVFRAKHVFVDPALSDTVIGVVNRIPKAEKIYPKGTVTVPLNLAAIAAGSEYKVSVLKTFVDVSRTSSSSGALRTVSTTDADARKGKNHRAGRPGATVT
jgi:hypothetical protein